MNSTEKNNDFNRNNNQAQGGGRSEETREGRESMRNAPDADRNSNENRSFDKNQGRGDVEGAKFSGREEDEELDEDVEDTEESEDSEETAHLDEESDEEDLGTERSDLGFNQNKPNNNEQSTRI